MDLEEGLFYINGCIEDDFFDKNPGLKKYPQIKRVIDEEGPEAASFIIWSLYLLIDPRSFIFDKKTFSERNRFVVGNYYSDFNYLKYKYLFEFYEEKIIINEHIVDYLQLKRIYESKVENDNKFLITKAIDDKNSLIIYSQKAFSVLNKSEEIVSGEKNKYPRTIVGDPEKDSIFEHNRELKYYHEVKNLIKDYGEKISSKILWSFFYTRDPKSFYFDKMDKKELEERCIKKYYKINFDDHIDIDEFYTENIILTEDVVDYNKLKIKYDILKSSNDSRTYTVSMAQKDRQLLTGLKNKISKTATIYKTIVIAGKKQPGLIARTRIA
ncbi:MAG: hypothetical protein WAT79_08985 [Saprospiraceae bacterium]